MLPDNSTRRQGLDLKRERHTDREKQSKRQSKRQRDKKTLNKCSAQARRWIWKKEGWLTMVVGVCPQHTELVPEHVKLDLDIGAILLRKQSS